MKRFSKSNNGEEEQIKEQKGHLGENQDWLSKSSNLEVLPPLVQALGRMEKMRTSVVIDDCFVIKGRVQKYKKKN